MTTILEGLALPIVQAPMAGGPSTPELAAAVNRGGGLGFLAAGYLTAQRLADDIETLLGLTGKPFGVNLFVGGDDAADPATVQAYAQRLAADARRAGVHLGEPRFDDDAFADKLAVLRERAVSVVSFTFGAPSRQAVDDLHAAGSEVWMTVTSPAEATQAAALGADVLIVQGVEAGGHRGVFVDDDAQSELTLLSALQLIRDTCDRPLVAAGLDHDRRRPGGRAGPGAAAGQVGTAYMRSTEAGTSEAQRAAIASDGRRC